MIKSNPEIINTSRILRKINSVQCLRALKDKGPLTRAGLARMLNTTRTTIGYAVQELMDAGLVANAAELDENPSRGRPGTALRLAPDGAYFVGVEIAVDRVAVLVADFVLHELRMAQEPIDMQVDGPETAAAAALRHAFGLIAALGLDASDIYGMGISIAGFVTPTGRVFVPGFDLWSDVDLAGLFARDAPENWVIKCCNDASASAQKLVDRLGDADKKDLFVVLLETSGIGSALVRNGVVEKGVHGMAGEIGYMCFDERVTASDRTFQALAARHAVAALAEGAQAPGDALRRWGELLAVGILNAIYLLDPANVVITGPLAAQYLRVERYIAEALLGRSKLGFETPDVSVVAADGAMAAGGAAALVRQDFFQLAHFVDEAGAR